MQQELVNTAFQLVVVLIAALLAWLISFVITSVIRKREHPNFFRYIGLIAPTPWAMLWSIAACLALIPATIGLFLLPELREMAAGANTVAGKVRASGLNADTIGMIAVMALLKTALSEEIFFRGLIAKRLIAWLGFTAGNLIQAAIFGAVHMLIFIAPGGPAFSPGIAALFFGVTAAGGWVMGFLNERAGNGSIAPSWLLHGLSNAVAYPVLAFV